MDAPHSFNILVIDDSRSVCQLIEQGLTAKGYTVVCTQSGQEGLDLLQERTFDLVLLDLIMPEMGGIDVLASVKNQFPSLEVVAISGGTIRMAFEALKRGAFDYLQKPIQMENVERVVKKIINQRAVQKRPGFRLSQANNIHPQLIGHSPGMKPIHALVDKVAQTTSNVLIQGETGTGKEVVAHLIHQKSARAKKRLVCVNVSALPETLLESELFGFEKGTFTNADRAKPGLLEEANEGTLFLDEIGEISLALQAKLLRVVETKKVRRLGSVEERLVDVRLMAATNKNLSRAIQEKTFRSDLYFRLSAVSVNLPPLRERREDIPDLLNFYLKCWKEETGQTKTIAPELMTSLVDYEWPGNVRELINVVESLVVLEKGDVLTLSDLPDCAFQPFQERGPELDTPVDWRIETVERNYIEGLMREYAGHKSTVARILGISLRSLNQKLSKFGIFVDVGGEPKSPR